MGKTPKPLVLVVHPDLMAWPEIMALRAQGHVVVDMEDPSLFDGLLASADAILAPRAWRMTPDLRPYLDLAVKAARNAKYGRTEAPND